VLPPLRVRLKRQLQRQSTGMAPVMPRRGYHGAGTMRGGRGITCRDIVPAPRMIRTEGTGPTSLGPALSAPEQSQSDPFTGPRAARWCPQPWPGRLPESGCG